MEDLVRRPDPGFWAGRSVLVTGHTGFKGSWALRLLAALGARVTGFSLPAPAAPEGYAALQAGRDLVQDRRGDLRDRAAVAEAIDGAQIVLHLGAQAIVSAGYRDPAGTWGSNLTGTLNLLDGLRGAGCQAAVIVTSDKVYRNDGARVFRETDALGGDDPYSASKAACEVLVTSYRASFDDLPPLATARAGNVIGGGDFGADRLVPDLVRAVMARQPLVLRHPQATRPFQHVLDVLAGYLLLAEELAQCRGPETVNFGPLTQEMAVRDLLAAWEVATDAPVVWQAARGPVMAEKPRLALDSALARQRLGWVPRFATAQAIADTARWYRDYMAGAAMAQPSDAAVRAYLEDL